MSSFDVRVWEVGKRTIRGKVWYRVRRTIAGQNHEKLYKTKALANSVRAELIQAINAGQPFDPTTGRTVAAARASESATTWYEYARSYIAMKWPRAAARSRRGTVETLTAVTMLLVRSTRGKPPDHVLRRAAYLYGLNPLRFNDEPPAEYAMALAWLRKASLPVSDLESPAVIRRVLDGLALRLDGKAAAAATVLRKRAVLYNAIGYAIEIGALQLNPIDRIQWTAPAVADAIDRRVVANPEQVRGLLGALGSMGPRAGRLVAFFGCLYYAGKACGQLRQPGCGDPTATFRLMDGGG